MSEQFDKFFPVLVAPNGKSETLEGEILRALNRIIYRNYNDGDRIGRSHGKETCDPPARFIIEKCTSEELLPVRKLVIKASSARGKYIVYLNKAMDKLLDHIESLDGNYTPNTEDMWDY